MHRIGRRAAVIAVTTIFGLGLLGSAAFAAFAPVPTGASTLVPSLPGTAWAEAPKSDHLRDTLDALVKKGVITQQQEDAIIAALRDRDRERAELMKRIFTGLFEQSATYLGVAPKELRAKLPGTSLAAIANATSGKSRDGLVTALVNAGNDAIAKALADGKITQAQADTLKAALPGRIAKFVDRTWPTPKPKLPNVRAFIGGVVNTARDYLGISQKDLMSALRSGKSLGEIADATSGKSRSGLIATLVTAADTKIDKAAADGKLTSAQAAQLKTMVQDAVAKVVDHKGTAIKSR